MKSGMNGRLAILRAVVFSLAVVGSSLSIRAQETHVAALNEPSTQNLSMTPAVRPSSANSAIRLGAGDLMEVSVYGVPDLNTKTRVQNNGEIYLPLIDYVKVEGLTIDEAQKEIERRFVAGGFLVDPHVTVLVDEFASQGVNVLGAVNKPGVYPVLGTQRVLDVLAAAGGLTERAGRTATITHKNQPGKVITVSLRENEMGEDDRAVQVLPGDTLIVHKADVVYVVGDVGHPSGLVMEGGSLTVLQAIALVGGTTRTAKLGAVKIIHKGSNGMTETSVPLKKILQAKVADVPLQPNDILFVPSSATKAAMMKSMDAIAQTASALTLVAVRP